MEREWSVTLVRLSINVCSCFSLSLHENQGQQIAEFKAGPSFSPPSHSVLQALPLGLSCVLCNHFRFDFLEPDILYIRYGEDRDTCALQ